MAVEMVELRELCSQIVDCPHSTPVWTDTGEIVLRSNNIRNGRLDLSSPSFTDAQHFEQRTKRATPRASDLVITREAPMGEVCLIPEGLRCCLGQRMVLLRPNPEKVDSRYLLYALQSSSVQHEIRVSEGTGSTVSNLRIPLLEALKIPWRPMPEQRRIAHILGSLDDKIELNRRMNETLEEMARALFKSWFVDFDPVRAKAEGRDPGLPKHLADLFPNRLVDTELGEVPQGWGVAAFSSAVDIASGGTPKTSERGYWDGEVPWFSVVDAPPASDVWVTGTQKAVTPEGIAASAATIMPKGTTILSARGTVGKVGLVGTAMAFNQSCYGFPPRSGEMGYFTYFATLTIVDALRQRAHGSVFSTITRSTLDGIRIAMPGTSLRSEYEAAVAPLLEGILASVKCSQVLGALREALLVSFFASPAVEPSRTPGLESE